MNQLNKYFDALSVRESRQSQKVRRNKKFLKNLLACVPEFENWEHGSFNRPFHLVKLNLNDNEADYVVHQFNNTMASRKGRQYTVKSIVKVENPFLLAQYYLRKKQLGKSVEDYEMYHGTGGECLIPICTNNFNWRFCGKYIYLGFI